jgi:membrane-associated phospholipid phosphatase
MKNNILMSLKPVDIATLLYLLISMFLIAFFRKKLDNADFHFLINFYLILGIMSLVAIHSKWKNPTINFVHLTYPLLLLSYFYGETAYLNHIFFAKDLDPIFIRLDNYIFGFQPSIEFSKHFHLKWFGEILNFSYFSYYFQTIGISLFFYIFRKNFVEKTIFYVISSFYIFYLIFIVLPVVGPQYYFAYPLSQALDTGIFSHAVKFIQKIGEHPTGSFPSSHVGMSIIIAIISFKYFRRLFYFILPFTFLILFSTVYIKAHYAVDVFAGIISAPIVLYLSKLNWKFMNYLLAEEQDLLKNEKLKKAKVCVK